MYVKLRKQTLHRPRPHQASIAYFILASSATIALGSGYG